MDFIKKHYEKVLFGLVLLGTAVAAAFLPVKIATEREELEKKRQEILLVKVKDLPPLDLTRATNAHQRLQRQTVLNFSSPHLVFNPKKWLRRSDNTLIPAPTADQVGPSKVEVTRITPLYLTITYDGVGAASTNYLVGVEREAESNPNKRRRKSSYVALNTKTDLYTVRQVKGTPEKPELVLELDDTGAKVSIWEGHPYQRVDGYAVDLRYDAEKPAKVWPGRRNGDKLLFSGDEFTVSINLIAPNQYEVVLSAKSTGKKTTIKYNVAP